MDVPKASFFAIFRLIFLREISPYPAKSAFVYS